MANRHEVGGGDPIDYTGDLSDAVRQLGLQAKVQTFAGPYRDGTTLYRRRPVYVVPGAVEIGVGIVDGSDLGPNDAPDDENMPVDADLAPAPESIKPERKFRKALGYFAGAIGSAALALTLFTNMGENPRLDAELEAEYNITQGDGEAAQAIREDAPDSFTMQEARWWGFGAAGSAAALGYFALGGLGFIELAEAREARRRKKLFLG